jgi:hypothetical protein
LFKAYSLITEIIKEKNLDSSYIHLLIKWKTIEGGL